MAGIPGKSGGVYVGSNKVKGVQDYKFAKNGKEIDVTSLDSNGWEEFIAGLAGMDCSFSGVYDNTDTTGQVALRDATSAQSMEVRWGTTTPKVAFSAIVTQFGIDAAVGDKVSFSCTVKPTGAGTFTG